MSHPGHSEVVLPKGLYRPLEEFPHLPVEDYLTLQADCDELPCVVLFQCFPYRS